MTASDADIIKWQLKCLTEHTDEMSTRELELIISFEDQFKRNGRLSERQMEILEEIYTRRT